ILPVQRFTLTACDAGGVDRISIPVGKELVDHESFRRTSPKSTAGCEFKVRSGFNRVQFKRDGCKRHIDRNLADFEKKNAVLTGERRAIGEAKLEPGAQQR